MADISTYLANILSAVYGRDVRQSIHDAIDAINDDAESTLTEVADARYNSVTETTYTTLSARLNTEYTDLKSDISITNKTILITATAIEQGLYNSAGNKENSSTRIRTANKLRIKRGARVNFTQGTSIEAWCYVSYADDGSKYFASGWFTTSQIIKMASETGYVALMFKKDDSTTITPTNYDATTNIIQDNDYAVTFELEGGTWSSAEANRFNYQYHDSRRRNKYPLIIEGNTMVMLPVGTGAIIFCGSNGEVIETHSLSTNGNAFFDIPSTAKYMDITINQTLSAVTVNIFGTHEPNFSKRIYRNNGDTIVQDIDLEPNLHTNMAYKLPPNYSASGEPVPLVLWIAGNTGYPQMGSGFPTSAITGLEYIRDEGFAILQVFSWGSYYFGKYPGCGKDQPYPVPIALRCLMTGIENFIDRYNIDRNNIHIIGRSFGGQMALRYALHPFDGLRSVVMFDPVVDFLSMRGRFSDARKALAEELSFDGSAAILEDFYDINEDGTSEDTSQGTNYYFSERCQPIWEANIAALIRLNVTWDNLIGSTVANNYAKALANAREWWFNGKDNTDTTIYNNTDYMVISTVPVKVCGALDDASTPLQAMAEKVAQLRNSGNPAETYFVPSGGHDAVSVSTTYAEDITTALNILCEDVPIGWIEAMKFIRKNS